MSAADLHFHVKRKPMPKGSVDGFPIVREKCKVCAPARTCPRACGACDQCKPAASCGKRFCIGGKIIGVVITDGGGKGLEAWQKLVSVHATDARTAAGWKVLAKPAAIEVWMVFLLPRPESHVDRGGLSAEGLRAVVPTTVLRALVQYPAGLERGQIGVLTGYKRSTRDRYIARLATRERPLVEADGARLRATADGRAALPNAEPLPVGQALRDWWAGRLPVGERAILDVLCARYPDAVARTVVDDETTFKRSTRDRYLSRLAAKELVVDAGRGEVRASETLFDGAG